MIWPTGQLAHAPEAAARPPAPQTAGCVTLPPTVDRRQVQVMDTGRKVPRRNWRRSLDQLVVKGRDQVSPGGKCLARASPEGGKVQ